MAVLEAVFKNRGGFPHKAVAIPQVKEADISDSKRVLPLPTSAGGHGHRDRDLLSVPQLKNAVDGYPDPAGITATHWTAGLCHPHWWKARLLSPAILTNVSGW
jgi:hypothetical protein